MADVLPNKRDFFVSYNKADQAWATWIAWIVEEADHSVWFQDWDFRGNFVEHMNRAHQQADRTLAVLSDHYFGSDFTLAEWSARFAQDPAAREDRLVPVKVGPLSSRGILNPIVYADMTGCDEAEAQWRLLERVKKALNTSYRSKPRVRPGFPGSLEREVPSKPQFPNTQAPTGRTDCVIIIRRLPMYSCSALKFKIFVDGEQIGAILNDEARKFNIDPGHHTLFVRAGSAVLGILSESKSDKLSFNVKPGETRRFVCSARSIRITNIDLREEF